jgi:hypothetical protein
MRIVMAGAEAYKEMCNVNLTNSKSEDVIFNSTSQHQQCQSYTNINDTSKRYSHHSPNLHSGRIHNKNDVDIFRAMPSATEVIQGDPRFEISAEINQSDTILRMNHTLPSNSSTTGSLSFGLHKAVSQITEMHILSKSSNHIQSCEDSEGFALLPTSDPLWNFDDWSGSQNVPLAPSIPDAVRFAECTDAIPDEISNPEHDIPPTYVGDSFEDFLEQELSVSNHSRNFKTNQDRNKGLYVPD